jgi:3-dehydroquinate dehydratase II
MRSFLLLPWTAPATSDWTGAASYATRAVMSQATTPPLIAVLNGPNMNMFGLRQPQLYGGATLDDVEQLCAETAEQLGLAIDFRQTNGEGELISWVQECRGRAQGIVINPAGYTTTSIALMDALLACELPAIEVHVTNIHSREEFRHRSYVSQAAVGVICGLGVRGYALALTAMADLLLEGRV